jgi:hypothetical protein
MTAELEDTLCRRICGSLINLGTASPLRALTNLSVPPPPKRLRGSRT